ncbi:LacI family transcriptional regulator [Pedobacter sp. BS3]|uniref:LacI family DNA-binding transcriptional regulator n=1 Tax=Pedobacter sp. BS3 TaxID=2567937 RepID=UPI0011EFA0D4|nr:LacI family DNA-binding transcriptional regulator [Pedobacter sp. BS3]TZF83091.1 LacI family transcriptional regulator [Pedobacter sp. BS3]
MKKYAGNKVITISDIAKELSVSKSTVSRALQDHHSISDATKQAVKRLAKQYNYHPNAIASSLFKKSTKTIGVIVPIISHYFFSTVISGIEDVAYKAGYKVIICQSNESYKREVDLVKTLLSAHVDGLIVSVSRETKNAGHFQLFLDKGIPLVFFDRLPVGIKSNSVSVDDYQGAYHLVEHLIKQGFKKIAHFAGPQHVIVAKNRFLGYKAALQKHHIPFDENLVFETGFERKHGAKAAELLLSRDTLPDAVFAVCDPVAIGLMFVLKQHGIKIPGDMAVAGFNDEPIATVIEPQLTTVVQPAFDMGVSAATIFLKKVTEDADADFIEKVHHTALRIRNSSLRLTPNPS